MYKVVSVDAGLVIDELKSVDEKFARVSEHWIAPFVRVETGQSHVEMILRT